MIEYRFFVPGIPQPGGSKKGFYSQKLGRVLITEDNVKSKDWRATVATVAAANIKEPLEGPLSVTFEFIVLRPKSHFGAKGLRSSAPSYPDKKPDTTKLIRSTEDAMKGITYIDDSQIVDQFAMKRYGKQAGCLIGIRTLEPLDCISPNKGGEYVG